MQVNPVAGDNVPNAINFNRNTGSGSGESSDSCDDWEFWGWSQNGNTIETQPEINAPQTFEEIQYAMAMKGKGKGKGGKGPCWRCGKTGHIARDCWYAPLPLIPRGSGGSAEVKESVR